MIMLESKGVIKSDVVTGLILSVFGAAVLIVSMRYSFGSLTLPGPGFVPRLASITLIVLSVLIIINSLITKAKVSVHKFFTTREAPKRVVLAAGAFFAYRLTVPFLGFIPTNFIFFLVVTRLLGHHSWKMSLTFSFLTTLLCYLLFQEWLGVPMPTTIFEW